MSYIEIARSIWRAELCEYSSAALREAGFDNIADEKDSIAKYHRDHAAILQDLFDAKASGDPDILSETIVRVAAFRADSRTQGVARPGILNNFTEPSDDELLNGA